MRTRAFVLALAALSAVSIGPAAADSRRDHERARAALEAGEIRPLAALIGQVEERFVGRIIETELEREGGRWIYELKLLPPSGAVFEIKLDAATGEIVRSHGRVQERPR